MHQNHATKCRVPYYHQRLRSIFRKQSLFITIHSVFFQWRIETFSIEGRTWFGYGTPSILLAVIQISYTQLPRLILGFLPSRVNQVQQPIRFQYFKFDIFQNKKQNIVKLYYVLKKKKNKKNKKNSSYRKKIKKIFLTSSAKP